MKKVKYIALILVLALGLIGGAYAAWTDALQVSGTVTTGTMDVNIQFANLRTPNYTVPEYCNISEDRKSVTFKIKDLYPTVYGTGGYSSLHFQVKNEGTIPVMLDRVEFTGNLEPEIWNWLRTKVHIHAGIPSGVNGTSLKVTDNLMGSPNPLEGNLKDLAQILMADPRNPSFKVLKNYVLLPGYAIRFGGETEEENSIRIYLDPEAPNTTQGEEAEFTLTFYWKQFNM